MSASFESLNNAVILRELDPDVESLLARLEIHDEIDSTNQALLVDDSSVAGKLSVCLAEYQSAGRGRRGRSWVAPYGGGLCFSVGWQFERQPSDLTALALAAGVVIRRALHEETGVDAKLKWPNDLVFDDKKLGGVLVELRAESRGPCHVVVGVGINVSIPSAQLGRIASSLNGAVDLFTATGGRQTSRNVLAARLIEGLSRMLFSYADDGFSTYLSDYCEIDYLRGRPVSLDDSSCPVSGLAVGVDDSGALLVDTGASVERIVAGDVSVRLVA